MANGVAGRPHNEALAIARITGDKTYEGSTHEKCGTSLRYTASGGCVYCARAKQAEMREALTAQQQSHAEADAFIEQAASGINEEPDPGLTAPEHATIPEPWD